MINTITLNPAVDKIMVYGKLNINNTNRLTTTYDSIGGKGTHISINLGLMGIRNRCFGIAYGETGKKIMNILSQYDLELKFLYKEGDNSRTNYILIDDDKNCTLLCEKGPQLTKPVVDEFLAYIEQNLGDGDMIVVSGDASNLNGISFSPELMRMAQKYHGRFVLDADGKFLKTGIKLSPCLIKPNMAELSELCDMPVKTIEEAKAAVRTLDPYGIEYVLVTCGKDGSLIRHDGKFYFAAAAKVTPVNTVGCGDAYLSGFLRGIEEGWDLVRTAKCAAAAGAAKALNMSTGGFDIGDLNRLMNEVSVTEI